MTEVMNLLIQLTRDFEVIRAYVLALKKSKLDNFKETWIDGQDVTVTGKTKSVLIADNAAENSSTPTPN